MYLILQTYAGIVWFKNRKDRSCRNDFVRFYRFSTVYYLAMIIQFTVFLIMGGNVVSKTGQIFMWTQVGIGIVSLVIISMYMTYID